MEINEINDIKLKTVKKFIKKVGHLAGCYATNDNVKCICGHDKALDEIGVIEKYCHNRWIQEELKFEKPCSQKYKDLKKQLK
jgi:hypothetical protein